VAYWIRQCQVMVRTEGVLGRSWTHGPDSDLRISFDITHTRGRDPNTAKVLLYGLRPDSRQWIQEYGKGITVAAGYVSTGSGDLFRGDITEVQLLDDRVIQVDAGDGDLVIGERKVSLAMRPGVTLGEVFAELQNTLGITVRHAEGLADVTYLHGVSMFGSVATYLDWICRESGCEWWVQDEQLVIVPAGGNVETEAQVVSPSTGLIGVPKRKAKKGRKVSEGDAGSPGDDRAIEWVQLLDSRMRPGRMVRLESEAFTGGYKANKVKFVGDTHDSTWECQVEGSEIGT